MSEPPRCLLRLHIRRISPLVLASAFIVLMLLIGLAAFMQPGFMREPESMQATGGAPQPTVTPTPEATPSPAPTPNENENENKNKKHEEKRPARRQSRPKKESIFDKAVKKVKKILPF